MVSISFIIPVYNVEPYVNRCLESVLSQDMTGVNMECIIVDDCGQDHSMELVRQLVDSYNGSIRFMIVEHEKNRGLSAARMLTTAARFRLAFRMSRCSYGDPCRRS